MTPGIAHADDGANAGPSDNVEEADAPPGTVSNGAIVEITPQQDDLPSDAGSPSDTGTPADTTGPVSKVGSDPTSAVAEHVGVGQDEAKADPSTADPSAPVAAADTPLVAEPAGLEPEEPAVEEPVADEVPAGTAAMSAAPTPTLTATGNTTTRVEPPQTTTSVGPTPFNADMKLEDIRNGVSRGRDGEYTIRVAPSPGVTITATPATGTIASVGRYYMLRHRIAGRIHLPLEAGHTRCQPAGHRLHRNASRRDDLDHDLPSLRLRFDHPYDSEHADAPNDPDLRQPEAGGQRSQATSSAVRPR